MTDFAIFRLIRLEEGQVKKAGQARRCRAIRRRWPSANPLVRCYGAAFDSGFAFTP